MPPASFIAGPEGRLIAVRHREGRLRGRPSIVFLPGYASDMLGTKAVALDAWAEATGHALIRLDYSGCGESGGDFEDGTLARWRDDAVAAIDRLADGPVLLVGSSMGGWIALLIARAATDRVAGLVGIAAAPDFTGWGFTAAEKAQLERNGRLGRPSDYGPEPTVTTYAFWQSGEENRVLGGAIGYDGPVRLIHGQRDADVPWEVSLDTARCLRSADVQVLLVKDGDHRLSRDQDIGLMIRTVATLMDVS